jgi:hypothetical protein
LKAFLMRAADDSMATEEWLVSLATYLATKPPSRWNDTDIDSMHGKLARLAPKYRAVESLAVQLASRGQASTPWCGWRSRSPISRRSRRSSRSPTPTWPWSESSKRLSLRSSSEPAGGVNLGLAAIARAAEHLINTPQADKAEPQGRHYDA